MKHVEAGHPKALRARKGIARAWLGVLPVVASAGIEQDGDEEEIEKALALFSCGDALCRPRFEERRDAEMTCVKVAPSTVRRDLLGRCGRQCNVIGDDGRRVGEQVPIRGSGGGFQLTVSNAFTKSLCSVVSSM